MGTKQPAGKYVKFIVYLVVIVMINVAATTLFFRIDLTENQAYSLSDASQQVVAGLSEPLTIKVFFSKNLPAPHNSTERYLRDLLEEYAAHANRHFNYRFYDVSTDAGNPAAGENGNQKLADNYGIRPIQIQVIDKDEVKFQKAYMGLVLIHGDIIEKIGTITNIDGLEYRLTTAIQKLNNKISALLRLEDKIKIRLYLSSSLETVAPFMNLNRLSEIPGEVQAVVDRLNRKNYGKLAFEYLDPEKTPGLAPDIKRYNLLHLSWQAIPEKNIKAGSGVSGLVMMHGDKNITIPLIQAIRLPIIGTQYSQAEMGQIEEILEANLTSMINIHQEIGILSGNGALNIAGTAPPDPTRRQQDNVTSIRHLIGESYSIRSVDLKEEMPGGVKCLIVARPTRPLSDYELFKIDQHLMQGNNIAFFMDAFEEVLPSGSQGMMGAGPPRYVPIKTGFEKLFAHWGIRIKPSYVMDEKCFKQRVPEQMGGGQRDIYFAPMIENRFISKELPFMKGIKGLIALKNSPLELDKAQLAKSGIKAIKLFASSERSWEMAGNINLNPMFISPPTSKEEMKSQPLAYLLSGEFTSYFAGKPIPEKPVENKDKTPEADDGKNPEPTAEKTVREDPLKIQDKGSVISKGKPGKVLLVGSSELLRDTIISQEGRSPNAIFIMNAVDYLNERENIAVMRSKEQRFNPLAETGSTLKTAVKAINIAGLPLMVVLFGLIVWGRRHARKKTIQMMFMK